MKAEKILGYNSDATITPYFKHYELADSKSGVVECDPMFLCYLSILRHTFGKAMNINSGCRTPEHNKAIGGHPNSFHLTENKKYKCACCAVDVSTRKWNQSTKDKFYALAKEQGWNIGVASTFIHIDRGQDFGKPFTTWTY